MPSYDDSGDFGGFDGDFDGVSSRAGRSFDDVLAQIERQERLADTLLEEEPDSQELSGN